MRLWLVVQIAALAPVWGCAARVGHLSLVSTHQADWPVMTLAAHVEGQDCASSVLFVPLRMTPPSVQTAIERALAGVQDAALLSEATVSVESLFTGVFNRQCIRVSGNAARLVPVVHLP
jgi:hypothetical protein